MKLGKELKDSLQYFFNSISFVVSIDDIEFLSVKDHHNIDYGEHSVYLTIKFNDLTYRIYTTYDGDYYYLTFPYFDCSINDNMDIRIDEPEFDEINYLFNRVGLLLELGEENEN